MLAEKVTLEYYRIPEYQRNRKINCVAFYLTLNAKHPLKYRKIPFWNLLVWGTTEIILNLIIRLRVITGLCCLWQASRFSVIRVEKLTPGGRKARSLGLTNDVLTYYFIRFSLAWIVIFLYLAYIVHLHCVSFSLFNTQGLWIMFWFGYCLAGTNQDHYFLPWKTVSHWWDKQPTRANFQLILALPQKRCYRSFHLFTLFKVHANEINMQNQREITRRSKCKGFHSFKLNKNNKSEK